MNRPPPHPQDFLLILVSIIAILLMLLGVI
jgi:hypothetical protein